MIEAYLNKRQGLTETSRKTIASKLRTVLDFGFEPARVVAGMKKQGYRLYTIQGYLSVAKGYEETMLGTALYKEYFKLEGYQFRNAYKTKTKQLNLNAFTSRLSTITDPDTYNFVYLCSKGLRKSEALSVKWEDFRGENTLVVLGKGDKQRLTPVQKASLKHTNSVTIVSPSFKSPNYVFNDLFPGFTPHDLRAMFITELVNSGKFSYGEVGKLVGHSSITTTARYVRVDQGELWQKLAKEGIL